MTVSSFIIMAIYISGIWAAYFQLHHWNGEDIDTDKEYQTLFMLSMLSWMIYPIYGFVWLVHKTSEED